MDHANVAPSKISYQLLGEMTNGFSTERELGSGTYGIVYLGVNKDGQKIAVKVLRDDPQRADELFEKEYHNLERLQHQNIVRLLGYCNETRQVDVLYEGNMVRADSIHRALCLEYMHNGSLDKCLYDESSGHDWHTRYAIIKGICKGLQYLHEELKPPVFHLDLKPANVLLDDDMMPRIADFGISRLLGEKQTWETITRKGTLGYLPREYIDHGLISNKLDIFSLGVTILQIMTGPNGHLQRDEISPKEKLIERVHGKWRNRLQATSIGALESFCEQVRTCITLALECVDADRQKRPTIRTIVLSLERTEPISIHSRYAIGEVVDDYKLDKIARYMDKPKTREDRAREALNLVHEENKEVLAFRNLASIVPFSKTGTHCLIYNATGDSLHYVASHDWHGHIADHMSYPQGIGNGQWAIFHHEYSWFTGSTACVVYRGKIKDGQYIDYLLAWTARIPLFMSNKSYCEVGGIDYFQTRWDHIYNKMKRSDNSSTAKFDTHEIDTIIGEGHHLPKFIAVISQMTHLGEPRTKRDLYGAAGQLHRLNEFYSHG